MIRYYVLLVCFFFPLCNAVVVDVTAQRLARVGPKPPPPPRYGRDLSNQTLFLPLCGNGRIDKKSDYESYYTTNGAFKIPFINNSVRVLADEMCDDGNRIDGDGCSADCMDFDAMVQPCAVHFDVPILDISIDPITGVSYVCTESYLAVATVTLNGMTLRNLASLPARPVSLRAYNSKVHLLIPPYVYTYDNELKPLLYTGIVNECKWYVVDNSLLMLTFRESTFQISNVTYNTTTKFNVVASAATT